MIYIRETEFLIRPKITVQWINHTYWLSKITAQFGLWGVENRPGALVRLAQTMVWSAVSLQMTRQLF